MGALFARIPGALTKRAKVAAARRGETLAQFVERAIRRELGTNSKTKKQTETRQCETTKARVRRAT